MMSLLRRRVLALRRWSLPPAPVVALFLLKLLSGGAVIGVADALPDALSLTVEAEGDVLDLNLVRRSVRTDDYQLKLWSSAGGYVPAAEAPEVRTYRGTVVGRPNQIVVAAVFPDGKASFTAFEGKSYKWRLTRTDVSGQLPPPTRALVAGEQEKGQEREEEDIVEEDYYDEADADHEDHVFDPPEDLIDPKPGNGYGRPPLTEEEDTEPCTRGRVKCQRGVDDRGETWDKGRRGDNNGVGRKEEKGGPQLRRQALSVLPPAVGLFPPSGGMKEAELVFDITYYRFVNSWGSDIDRAVAEVEYLANVHDHFMARDAMIAIVVPQVVVRTDEFYFPTGMGNQLSSIAAEWKGTELGGTRWDMINSFRTSQGLFGAGGYAYGCTIGKDEASSSVEALYHENGHNWCASHLIYGKDTMDGNRPHHGPINIEKVLAKREEEIAEGTFDDVPAYPDPLHPYAHVDLVTTLTDTPVDVDVLANDWDGNAGDVVSIRTFSASTAAGGSVVEIGGGLRYTPAAGYVGKDIIYYEVQDGTGLYTQELVHVEVINRGLALHYAFEDLAPCSADDTRGHSHHGWHSGEPSGGVLGAGLRMVGTGGLICDDRNLVPVPLSDDADDYPLDSRYQGRGNSFDPMDESYTLDFWFRLDNVTSSGAELVNKEFHGEQKYGFRVWVEDGTGALKYSLREFRGAVGRLERSAGTVPSGTWHHLAFVIDRDSDSVLLYLNGNVKDTALLEPDAFLFMGRRPLKLGAGGDGSLSLDEVRVHTRSLSAQEVRDYVILAGRPVPQLDILEAEDASYGGASFQNNKAGYSGTGFVDYTASGSEAYVEWTVPAASEGSYDVSLKYALQSGDRPLDLAVNGQSVGVVDTPATGSWSTWTSTAPVTVTLVQGTNTVRASATGSSGPNVDYLLVEQILSANTQPRFSSGTIAKDAVPGKPIAASLANDAFDFDLSDSLTFQKVSGPAWLSVDVDGSLSGTPDGASVGLNSFAVRVTDSGGLSDDANLEVTVDSPESGIIDLDAFSLLSYGGGQDDEGAAVIENYGVSLYMTGNRWKTIALSYALTSESVLEFDFQSCVEGEEHSIGLDTDLSLTDSYRFKLYGTQQGNTITAFEDYESSAPATKHYIIPIGQYYTGSMSYLFFANDHDVSNPDGQSRFSNIKLYESSAAPPTSAPTSEPSNDPTLEPTSQPTQEPTQAPTLEPTSQPTLEPTQAPTSEPTSQPTPGPTLTPTDFPTPVPSSSPSMTSAPTKAPTTAAPVTPAPVQTVTKYACAKNEPNPADICAGSLTECSTLTCDPNKGSKQCWPAQCSPGACKGNGLGCDASAECCSLFCAGTGVCADDPGNCAAAGEACADKICCSGQCPGGKPSSRFCP